MFSKITILKSPFSGYSNSDFTNKFRLAILASFTILWQVKYAKVTTSQPNN
ncbi:hypothetical protein GASC598B02_014010 [Gilliamella apicola SCGC AB-598-B02]|nr:hypothetical protein GASC598B02_014010 [Gilliamella apicola SCGC AB-598-B02]